MTNERFIVRSVYDKTTDTTSWIIKDNHRSPEYIAGVGTKFSSLEEASYVAWALNTNPQFQRQVYTTTF